MQRDDVRFGKDVVERGGGGSSGGDVGGRDDGIVDEHTAFECAQARNDFAPDAAKADDTDGLVAQRFHLRHRHGEPPVARAEVGGVGHDLPREAQDIGERVVRDFIDAVVGNVRHRDAPLARGVEVHIVHTDAVADDRARLVHRGDDVRVDARELRDHRVGIRDERDEFRLGLALPRDELAARHFHDGLLDGQVGKEPVGNDDVHGLGS